MRSSPVLGAVLGFASVILAQVPGFDPITSPTQDQVLKSGENFNIVWQHSGAPDDAKVTIKLLQGKTPSTLDVGPTITSNHPSKDGQFTWSVPANLESHETYGFSLSLDNDPTIFQYSFPFHITGLGGDGANNGGNGAPASPPASPPDSTTPVNPASPGVPATQYGDDKNDGPDGDEDDGIPDGPDDDKDDGTLDGSDDDKDDGTQEGPDDKDDDHKASNTPGGQGTNQAPPKGPDGKSPGNPDTQVTLNGTPGSPQATGNDDDDDDDDDDGVPDVDDKDDDNDGTPDTDDKDDDGPDDKDDDGDDDGDDDDYPHVPSPYPSSTRASTGAPAPTGYYPGYPNSTYPAKPTNYPSGIITSTTAKASATSKPIQTNNAPVFAAPGLSIIAGLLISSLF